MRTRDSAAAPSSPVDRHEQAAMIIDDSNRRYRRMVARSLAWMYATAALLTAVWVALPHERGTNETAIILVALLAVGVAGALLTPAVERSGMWILKVAVSLGAVLTSTDIFFSVGSDFALFYLWASAYAFCFFSRRQAALQSAFAALALGVTLVLQPDAANPGGPLLTGVEMSRWLLVMGTMAAVGLVVRRLTESLRQSERRFGQCIQDAFVGMGMISLEGRWLHVNRALCRLLGRESGELTDSEVSALIHPDDLERFDAGVRRALAREAPAFSLELRLLGLDGEPIWTDVLASLISDEEDQPRWFFAQILDIGARRAAEEQRERARALVDQRASEQSAVAELGRRALETAELSELADAAAASVAEILGVERCEILELAAKGSALRRTAGVGWPEGEPRGARRSAVPDAPWGRLLAADEPVVLGTEPEEAPALATLGLGQEVLGGAAVPIRGRRQAYGLLGAYSTTSRELTAGDLAFLTVMATVLATAIERAESEEATRYRALHDVLTDLPNRTLFLDRLEHALGRGARAGRSVAVMLADLDEFKVINDSLGHQAGDELLAQLAPRLREAVRPNDTVARLGGDEFVLLCEDLDDPRDALTLAERLTEAWASPFALQSGEVFVTASTGIALSKAEGEGGATVMLREADAAMYRAKERGRGRYELFDEVMRAHAFDRLRTENDLRRALDRGEFRLAYQPIVDLEDGRPVAVEALLRWQHPERGPIAPDAFVPLTEETGLIVSIGAWAFEKACGDAAGWRREHPDTPINLSVNFSGRQLMQPGLAEGIETVLRRHELPPDTLSLEITESVLMAGAEPLETLCALERLGVRLVLDDFGTGYSSLSYLQHFPLHTLKLDRSFVSALGSNGGSPIVGAVVSMARALGLTVVAEGIETPDQLAQVRRLGCHQAQGYLLAAPGSREEIERFLTRSLELGPEAAAPSRPAPEQVPGVGPGPGQGHAGAEGQSRGLNRSPVGTFGKK